MRVGETELAKNTDELVKRAAAGEAAALTMLLERHRDRNCLNAPDDEPAFRFG